MRHLISTLLLLTLAACATQPTPAPVPVKTDSPAPSAIPLLSADDVSNALISLSTLTGETPIPYQLTDGKYQPDAGGAGDASISLLGQMAFGDLNNDGAGDAAVLVAENYGGSGTFVSLVVFLNKDGQPVQTAITPIDDRPEIQDVSITDGRIALEATIHSFEDPMCCPTLGTTRHYALDASELVLRDFSTQAADSRWREILITVPLDGESAASVKLTGIVTVSPFENNLSYHVYDATGVELAAGPVSVSAAGAGLGTPGTFDTTIVLNGIPAGTTVRVEIQDLSAADGSLLAMDSVVLTIK
jgi:hypothetical protein